MSHYIPSEPEEMSIEAIKTRINSGIYLSTYDVLSDSKWLVDEVERLEAKVKRFHQQAKDAVSSIVLFTDVILKLREALEEILIHSSPQKMWEVAQKALKRGEWWNPRK